jgi:hypothetical protein
MRLGFGLVVCFGRMDARNTPSAGCDQDCNKLVMCSNSKRQIKELYSLRITKL